MTRPRVVRRLWARRIDRPGMESATLFSTPSGWRLTGTVRTDYPEGPASLRYQIDCGPGWGTRNALLELKLGESRRSVRIARDERDRWQVGGLEQRDLRGCTDIDLTATAMTNTIPIRRLELPVGAKSEIRSAWVTFPDLEVHPVRQIYTRVAEDRYRFEAPHNAFVAEFDVDDFGFVILYPDYWERVPAPRGQRSARSSGAHRSRGRRT